MAALREKLDKVRIDAIQESEETMSELKNVYEREKSMLVEETKKLHVELERQVDVNSRLQMERRSFEEEYQDLRNKKEAVQQWEAQIQEIINWVSDEKDARGYLQASTIIVPLFSAPLKKTKVFPTARETKRLIGARI